MKISTAFPHGIDITAPGGIDALLAFHRARFGDAQMNANEPGAGGDRGTSGGSGGDDGGGDSGGGPGADGEGDPDKGLKSALAAERDASKQAKAALAAAEARVKELEDASKSEEQRLQEAQEKKDADLASALSGNAAKDAIIERYRVAAEKGLNLNAAERLQGSTREEIEKDADDWIALWGTGGGRQEQHRGDPGQGARTGAQESSYAQGAERAKARYGEQK